MSSLLKKAGTWGFLIATFAITLPQANAAFSDDQGPQYQKEYRRGQRRQRRPHFGESVHHNVVFNRDAGTLTITITSDDAETVSGIQDHEPKSRPDGKVTTTKTNISNGIQIVKTTTDENILDRWEKKANRKAIKDSITRTVSNTTTGASISWTSTNSEAIEKLKAKAARMNERPSRNDKVTRSVSFENNTLTITISAVDADDQELIEKIQKRAAEGKKHGRHGKGKRRGSRRYSDQ